MREEEWGGEKGERGWKEEDRGKGKEDEEQK